MGKALAQAPVIVGMFDGVTAGYWQTDAVVCTTDVDVVRTVLVDVCSVVCVLVTVAVTVGMVVEVTVVVLVVVAAVRMVVAMLIPLAWQNRAYRSVPEHTDA